ncbi:MAG: YCF48-related protein [Bacteroidota bacterium]
MKPISLSKLNILITLLVSLSFINLSMLDAQQANYYWGGVENRANEAASKDGLMPIQKLEGSPQKVNIGPTGNFTLDVPLMVIPGRGGLNFDLKLQYTPGITVTQEASWVGLGWDLNPGSVVRNIFDSPDMSIIDRFIIDPELGSTVVSGVIRDMYSINLGSRSGKALQYIDPQNTNRYAFQLEEWRAWKIQYDASNGHHRFIVTTEDGTVYIFGRWLAGATSNSSAAPGSGLPYPSYEPFLEWKLTAVYAPGTYTTINDITALPDDPSRVDNAEREWNWIAVRYAYDGTRDKAIFYYTDEKYRPLNSYIKQIKLTEVTYPRYIITPTHIAEFITEDEEYNPILQLLGSFYEGLSKLERWWDDYFRSSGGGNLKRRLTAIKLYRNPYPSGIVPAVIQTADLGTPIREIDLSYKRQSDFDISEYQEKRTMLKSVTIKAGQDSLPPYKFTYHDIMGAGKNDVFKAESNVYSGQFYDYLKAFSPEYLYGQANNYLMNTYVGMDGYYNSMCRAYSNVNDNQLNIVKGDRNDGKQWNLKTVTYPTGAVQEFDYESNCFAIDFTYRGNYVENNGFGGITWGLGSRLISQKLEGNTYIYSYGISTIGDPNNFQPDVGRMFADQFEFQNMYLDNILFPPQQGFIHQQTNHPVLYERVIETQPEGSQIISYYQVAKLDEDLDPESWRGNNQERFNRTFGRRGNLLKREYVNDVSVVSKRESYITEEKPNLTSDFDGSISYQAVQQSKQTIIFDNNLDANGIGITTVEEHIKNSINGLDSIVIISDTTATGRNPLRTTAIRYAFEPPTDKDGVLLHVNRISEIAEITTTENSSGDILSHSKIDYSMSDWLPHWYYEGEDADVLVKTIAYNIYPNVRWQSDGNGYTVSTQWGYNHSVPIATAYNLITSPSPDPLFVYEDFTTENFNSNLVSWSLTGNWQRNNGTLAWRDMNSKGYLTASPITFDKHIAEFEIKTNFSTSNSSIGFCFRALTHEDVTQGNGYCILINANQDILLTKAGIELIRSELPPTSSTTRIIKISVDHNNIFKIFVDGELIIDYIDLETPQYGTYIGIFASNIDCEFDNLRIYMQGALCTMISYDPLTLNITSKTDENNNTYYYSYDNFRRLKQQIAPTGELTREYDYYYGVSPSLNLVMADLYRSEQAKNKYCFYFDGWGDKIQQHQYSGDTLDIITHNYYDNMRRLMQSIKPYMKLAQPTITDWKHHTVTPIPPMLSMKKTSGIGQPTIQSLSAASAPPFDPPDDPIYNSRYYYNSEVYFSRYDETPYSRYEYYHDGTNRIRALYPPGDGNQRHPISYQYTYNTDNDNTGFQPQQLFKTITIDENGVINVQYHDKLDNMVRSVVDVDRLKLTTSFVYDAGGKLLKSTPPNRDNYATIYSYDFRQRLSSKLSPDAGIIEYKYDANNNIRFIKDRNHSGNPNACAYSDTLQKVKKSFLTSKRRDFILTRPGRVYFTIQLFTQGTHADTLNFSIRETNLNTILLSGTYISNGLASELYSNSIVLPKGNYFFTCSRKSTADPTSKWVITIQSIGGYEFVYRKYDGLNRLIEEGEFNTQDNQDHFTRENAETVDFPTTNTIPVKQFIYDTLSSHPYGSDARNLAGKLVAAKSYRFGVLVHQAFYSYDSYGRVEWIGLLGSGIYPKKIKYQYDRQGNVVEKDVFSSNTGTLSFFYSYNDLGRLAKVESLTPKDRGKRQTEATYEYFASGKIKRTVLGSIQGMDYRYNERDWLEYINNPYGEDPGMDGPQAGLLGSRRTGNGMKAPVPQKKMIENGIASNPVTAAKTAAIQTVQDRFAVRLVYNDLPCDDWNYIQPIPENQWQYNGNISSIMYKYDSVYQGGKVNAPNNYQQIVFNDESNGCILYGDYYLQYTHDGGATWDTVITLPENGFQRMSFVTPDIGYALHDFGNVYKTINGGFTWTPVTRPSGINFQSAQIQFLTTSVGYVSALEYPYWPGLGFLYKTTDGGITWEKKSVQGDTSPIMYFQFTDVQTGYLATFLGTVWKTTDGGDTWTNVLAVPWYQNCKIFMIDSASGFVLCKNGNIYKTTDGGVTWVQYNCGVDASNSSFGFNAIKFIDRQKGFILGENGIVLQTTDGGMTWTQHEKFTDATLTTIHFPSHSVGYLGGWSGALFKTTDGGETWQSIAPKVDDSSDVVAYRFTYDGANRLTEGSFHWNSTLTSSWNRTDLYTEALEYDPNGNIKLLSRSDNSGVAIPNDYDYYPNTNKLRFLGSGVPNPGSVYRYDGNGNMIRDPNNNLKFIIYDCNNMPLVEYKGSQKIEYTYDAQGNRISKLVNTTKTYYVIGADGKIEMVSSEPNIIQRINLWGADILGHIKLGSATATRYYYLKDHLGSVRMTVNKNGKVVCYDDYYPYGSIMPGRSKNMAIADEQYKFSGKELDNETGYEYFGARYYDAKRGQWTTIDPDKETYPCYSPYCYSFNNPMRFWDPDGRRVFEAKSASENRYYQAAKDLYLRTAMGRTQWNNYINNPNILVIYQVMNLPKISGEQKVLGQTRWEYQYTKDYIQNLDIGEEVVKLEANQVPIFIFLDHETLKESLFGGALLLYDEGGPHIDPYINSKSPYYNEFGVGLNLEKEHQIYGSAYSNDIRRKGSIADKYYQQLLKAMKQLDVEKKKKKKNEENTETNK